MKRFIIGNQQNNGCRKKSQSCDERLMIIKEETIQTWNFLAFLTLCGLTEVIHDWQSTNEVARFN